MNKADMTFHESFKSYFHNFGPNFHLYIIILTNVITDIWEDDGISKMKSDRTKKHEHSIDQAGCELAKRLGHILYSFNFFHLSTRCAHPYLPDYDKQE